MVDWVVMQCDIEAHPKFGKTSVDNILWNFGMDVTKGYLVEDNHGKEKPEDWPEDEEFFGYNYRSPFTGKMSKGPKYTGVARQDGKWKRFVSDFLELSPE